MRRGTIDRSVLAALIVAGFFALHACSDSSPTSLPKGGEAGGAGKASGQFAPADVDYDKVTAILNTTQGKIMVEFFPEKAPEHVKNFVTLAKNGYYDGTYFHRVYPGFMIQGGDPNTKDDDPANDGNGGHSYKGPGTTLRAEFNDIKHLRGVLSMAKEKSPDSAGSQFFIMVANSIHLDGKYSAFGKVIEGMDVVDRIVKQPGNPIPIHGGVNPLEHQYVRSIDIIEKD